MDLEEVLRDADAAVAGHRAGVAAEVRRARVVAGDHRDVAPDHVRVGIDRARVVGLLREVLVGVQNRAWRVERDVVVRRHG